MKHTKILVTGAAGFIGSQLCNRLIQSGSEVLGLDNMNSHLYDPILKVARVQEFRLNLNVVDLRDYDALERELVTFKPEIIVHLAAHAGVRDSYGRELEYHGNNIDGTQNLINACRKHLPDTRIVYASTSCIYAGSPVPWREDRVEGMQLNAYGWTKRANECQFVGSGLNTTGFRFFTVYGPWGRPDMALFNFTKKILDGEEIEVYNYGKMKRDFTYVEDILDGIMIVLQNKDIAPGEIFNIGNGKQVDLMDFVREIEKNCGREAKIKLAPKHPADTLETWSDVSKLAALGYEPKVDVKEGIKNFFDWYRWYHGVN
jgi:UDP-glucuronate 4-epimerase